MTYQTILLEKNHIGLATLTLNRPAVKNAFNDDMIAEMTHAICACGDDPQVRLLLLRSSGSDFSAGADLQWMKSMAKMSQAENRADAEKLSQLMHRLYTCPKPTLVRVQGAAFGGALGLIACCDMAIGTTDARFCLSEVKLGLVPAVISPYVIKAIGSRHANRYFLTAEMFDAPRAAEMGLLSACCADTALDEQIQQIVSAVLRNGPQAVQEARQLIRHVEGQPIDDRLRQHTAHLIARVRVSPEGQEGLSAFLEKRTPAWKPHS